MQTAAAAGAATSAPGTSCILHPAPKPPTGANKKLFVHNQCKVQWQSNSHGVQWGGVPEFWLFRFCLPVVAIVVDAVVVVVVVPIAVVVPN